MPGENAQRAADKIALGDNLLLKEKRLDAAEQAYRHALLLDPFSAEAMHSIACVFSHRKQFEEALTWARRALQADPNHRDALRQVGNALLGLERLAEARAVLEESYRRAPDRLTRAHSVRSEWVKSEVTWAIKNRWPGPVIPVIMETCDTDELHLWLSRLQHVDFTPAVAREKLSQLFAPSSQPI